MKHPLAEELRAYADAHKGTGHAMARLLERAADEIQRQNDSYHQLATEVQLCRSGKCPAGRPRGKTP